MGFRTTKHSKPLPPKTEGCPSTDHSFLALPHFTAPPVARHMLSPVRDLVWPCGSPATTGDWLLEAWRQKLTKKEQISCHHQPWRMKEEKTNPQEKAEHGQITVRAATSAVPSGCWPPGQAQLCQQWHSQGLKDSWLHPTQSFISLRVTVLRAFLPAAAGIQDPLSRLGFFSGTGVTLTQWKILLQNRSLWGINASVEVRLT